MQEPEYCVGVLQACLSTCACPKNKTLLLGGGVGVSTPDMFCSILVASYHPLIPISGMLRHLC